MNDLKFAFRQLLKNPGFTAVAVITLALGIGANTAIFTVVNAVLLRPLPYPDSDRLMRFQEQLPAGIGSIAYPNFLDWKADQKTFEKFAVFSSTGMALTAAGDAMQLRVAQVTGEFFEVLRPNPLLGRLLGPEDDVAAAPQLVVLHEDLWRARFGSDPAIIGK